MTTTAAHRSVARTYPLIGLLLLLAAAFVRLWQISTRPGFEWDEPVYEVIGRNEAAHGLLQTKTEVVASPEPYLYHPPFYYKLLGWWFELFGAGVTQARVLAAIGSLLMLVLLWALLRRLIGNWALLAVALIAFDGWMVFSNRISWIENTMMPIGVAGLWLYVRALGNPKVLNFALAGFLLGATAVYKHLGIYFLGAAVIHWIVIRREGRGHAVLLAVAVSVIVSYIGSMFLVFGDVYERESGVQVLRSLGQELSRGSIDSLGDLFGPLMAQYKIFVSTLVLAAIGGGLLIYRTVLIIRHRAEIRRLGADYGQTVLYSWAVAGVLLLAVSQIKLPQYFLMVIVPLYCFIVSEVRTFVAQSVAKQNRNQFGYATRPHIVVGALAAVLMLAGLGASAQRMYGYRDRALQDVATWTAQPANMPTDAIVITEESVGTTIKQPYCKLWRGDTCAGATHIITYTSHTQKPSTENRLMDLVATATEVYRASGYKETLVVYRLPRPVRSTQ
ncbi:MAG TPA: glycosyltransferase family 39 protein [Candidatus Saccharimonadales bacterium]|nr:glycosyltransferase family 39 protein [Candidatus Saccharimonadales bacterium]